MTAKMLADVCCIDSYCGKIRVDNQPYPWYNTQALGRAHEYRGVEQLEARRAHNPEVVGSSPASATIKIPGIHYEYRDFSNFLV